MDGELAGRVTSGGFGYSVERSIAYAYLPARAAGGPPVEVEIFGEWVAGVVAPSRCSILPESGSGADASLWGRAAAGAAHGLRHSALDPLELFVGALPDRPLEPLAGRSTYQPPKKERRPTNRISV